MEPEHWHRVWTNNELGFHQAEGNPMLRRWLPELNLPAGSRVLVPLCGKTPDLAWLASHGFEVVGIELSDVAARDFFAERSVVPTVSASQGLTSYSADGVTIVVADFFAVGSALVGPVDAVYDRAALVALPFDMRSAYTAHLLAMTDGAAQLLVTFEYEQDQLAGPPFSVDGDEVARLYAETYSLTRLDDQPVDGGLRGISAFPNPSSRRASSAWLSASHRLSFSAWLSSSPTTS